MKPHVRRCVMFNDGRGHRTSAWSSVSSPSKPVHPSMGGGQKVMKKKNLITPKPPILGFRFRKRFPICLVEQDADDSVSCPELATAQAQPTAEINQPLQLSFSRWTQLPWTRRCSRHGHTGAQIALCVKLQTQVRISAATRIIFSLCSVASPFHRSTNRATTCSCRYDAV